MRPVQRTALAENYGFSPDGSVFIVTMNAALDPALVVDGKPWYAEYNNTSLHRFILGTGEERIENLGPFWPKRIDTDHKDLILTGEWRQVLCIDCDFDEGFYTTPWTPWKLEKHITRHVDM